MSDSDALLLKIDAVIEQAKDAGADAVTVQLLINAQLAQVITTKDTEIARLRDLVDSLEHWLSYPPTTNSDRTLVADLCRRSRATLDAKP